MYLVYIMQYWLLFQNNILLNHGLVWRCWNPTNGHGWTANRRLVINITINMMCPFCGCLSTDSVYGENVTRTWLMTIKYEYKAFILAAIIGIDKFYLIWSCVLKYSCFIHSTSVIYILAASYQFYMRQTNISFHVIMVSVMCSVQPACLTWFLEDSLKNSF